MTTSYIKARSVLCSTVVVKPGSSGSTKLFVEIRVKIIDCIIIRVSILTVMCVHYCVMRLSTSVYTSSYVPNRRVVFIVVRGSASYIVVDQFTNGNYGDDANNYVLRRVIANYANGFYN